jgi:hypothetical protein
VCVRVCGCTHTHTYRGVTLPQAFAAGTPVRAGKVWTDMTDMTDMCPGKKGERWKAREEEEEKGGGEEEEEEEAWKARESIWTWSFTTAALACFSFALFFGSKWAKVY